MKITEHTAETDRHKTFYLASGPEKGPLIIFLHGWPELSISWRHQLPVFGGLGFRAIAPDMRGYGRSGVYRRHQDYRQEAIVADMIDLLDSLGRKKAVWVGHDWGSPVAWNIASHHPDRSYAVASLCVPYYTLERGLDQMLSLVDRDLYPVGEYPAGQWDYMLHYEESFAEAIAPMDRDPYRFVKLLFRKGNASYEGTPALTATARRDGGMLGMKEIPDLPRDSDVVTEEDLLLYSSALQRNGFFGPSSWYMNHGANAVYAGKAENSGYLDMPALFVTAKYDFVCECVHSNLASPMRRYCRRLSEKTVDAGHWVAQEKPYAVNASLVEWVVTTMPGVWESAR